MPGLVRVEDGPPVRLVTRAAGETGAALEAQGTEVRRVAALDLEEILGHLIDEHRERTEKGA